MGLLVQKSNSHFYLYNTKHSGQKLDSETLTFSDGDIYDITFDFVEDEMEINFNTNKIVSTSLDRNKCIIAAFSLDNMNDCLEILNYSFSQL